jgi:uncharacterized protein YndB with AHSA1/START domain
MQHGTYEETGGHPALRFERRLAHPVDAVWRAVTEPDELAHWFPAQVQLDLRAGGALSFAFPDDTMPDGSGEVTELVPPRVFAFTWDGDEIRIELEPAGEETILRFTHVLSDRDSAAKVAAGWHVCLDQLDDRLGGGAPGLPPTEPTPAWHAYHEDYRKAFPSPR